MLDDLITKKILMSYQHGEWKVEIAEDEGLRKVEHEAALMSSAQIRPRN